MAMTVPGLASRSLAVASAPERSVQSAISPAPSKMASVAGVVFTGLFFYGAVLEQVFQLGHEFLHVLEVHIDAGETHVGDFVQFFQAMHDHFADFGGGEFALSGFLNDAFDFIDDGFEFGSGHGALFAGFQEALKNFLALEAFAASVLLDDHVGNFVDAFVGGEAARAFETVAAAADGVAGAAFAGVDNLVVGVGAEWALQLRVSPWCGAFGAGRSKDRPLQGLAWLKPGAYIMRGAYMKRVRLRRLRGGALVRRVKNPL